MDSSHLSPLITPIPQLTHPLDLFNTSVANRQIRGPVPPSKHVLLEISHNDIGEGMKIVAIRQRRERAWHARILNCTSVIINIDSTLADFKDEISKKEATAFQASLRQAISKFAAHESLPTPPPIPSKSLQKKQSEIPNPKLPNKPIAKKANHVERLNEPRASSNSLRRQALEGNSTPPGNVDKRIFLRLPQEHEWRNLSPAGIREIVIKKLAISPATIGRIKPIYTGFALSPCSNDAQEKILEAQLGLYMSGAKLEPATN
ncbi:putative eka-like protein [Erysiphe necator]|uniref:Putative eka-like protein n=1 Tax=Uncinula necator TaxID=52586 RepID=A0A0B1PDN6_UNCNE|nr:putative eka-like protein [Erysiphe necator]